MVITSLPEANKGVFMTKLFLFLSLISVNAFAGTLILEKHATSGYVAPEHSFQKDCSIYREGYVESYTKKGDGTIIGFTHMVSKARIFEIRQLLNAARHFAIVNGPVTCDAGSISIYGHRASGPVLLKDQKDCNSYKFRKGWAAQRLRNIAGNLCAF